MAAETSAEEWLPRGAEIAIERVDAADLEARAASAGICAYAGILVVGRRREYLAGRLAARTALQTLGADDLVVGRNDSAPVWPIGYCGSISHSAELAVAIVARSRHWRALGIDIEVRFAANRIRVMQQAMSVDEFCVAQASVDPWVWTRAWAAKEAAYKCLSVLGADLAFDALLPRWKDADRAELEACVDGAAIQVDLRCRIQHGLIWMVASTAVGD